MPRKTLEEFIKSCKENGGTVRWENGMPVCTVPSLEAGDRVVPSVVGIYNQYSVCDLTAAIKYEKDGVEVKLTCRADTIPEFDAKYSVPVPEPLLSVIGPNVEKKLDRMACEVKGDELVCRSGIPVEQMQWTYHPFRYYDDLVKSVKRKANRAIDYLFEQYETQF